MIDSTYVRVGREPARIHATEADLLFVDIDRGGSVAAMRGVAHRSLERARTLIARPTNPSSAIERQAALKELMAVRDRLELNAVCGVLVQPVGAPATVEWDSEVSRLRAEDHQVIGRCRASEVAALSAWGNAVWRSETFHYRLPSGEHTSAFVRVGDVLASLRDAEVLASWLYQDLVDGVGLLHDTGTVTAIVAAAVGAMYRSGVAPGAVLCLDGYPRTDLAVSAAFQKAAGSERKVVALLSVNSSGRVLDRLAKAANALGPGAAVAVHVLVDKHRAQNFPSDADGSRILRWHPFDEGEPLVPAGAAGDERCQLCEQATTARLVPIDPHTFDGRLASAILPVVPDPSDGRDNRLLWEHADRLSAIVLEQKPDAAIEGHRPRGSVLPVGVHNKALVADERWRTDASRLIRESVEQLDAPLFDAPAVGVDVLLVPQHESTYVGMDKLISELRPILGAVQSIHPFDPLDGWTPEAERAVKTARSVVAFTLGSVTGVTLQRMLVAAQRCRPEGGYRLTALVCHARPIDRRDWITLNNSWGRRLCTAWHTFLPDRQSPLADEREVLQQHERPEKCVYESFIEERLLVCGGDTSAPLFWGSSFDERVTPNSIFGEGIGERAVYAAVGSAMERTRTATPRAAAPELRVFELAAMTRSYYDPLILAAMLRWVRPHEVWWGWDERHADEVLAALIERGPATQPGRDRYRTLILGELLLAAAQGKLPPRSLDLLRAHATAQLSGVEDDRGGAILTLGLALL